jgi:hypothetical protein
VARYARQSPVTDPGAFAVLLDQVPAELDTIRQVATRMVFHYRAGGHPADHGVPPERADEINTRYVDRMLALLDQRSEDGMTADRRPDQRVLGCCRDYTALLVAMARHHGIPARARVGFAGYFVPGWWIDHVVAEVWDAGRWRLVEPQVDAGHVDPTDGVRLDVLDLDRRRFLTGPGAWRACRSGGADPDRFVVAPELELPVLRSWNYLVHNLVLDLAALDRQEMVLWDVWGALASPEPATAIDHGLLDELARDLTDRDADPDAVAGWLRRPELAVPPEVISIDPLTGVPRPVTLRTQGRTGRT